MSITALRIKLLRGPFFFSPHLELRNKKITLRSRLSNLRYSELRAQIISTIFEAQYVLACMLNSKT